MNNKQFDPKVDSIRRGKLIKVCEICGSREYKNITNHKIYCKMINDLQNRVSILEERLNMADMLNKMKLEE